MAHHPKPTTHNQQTMVLRAFLIMIVTSIATVAVASTAATPAGASLPTVIAESNGGKQSVSVDGLVEAVRQTVIAAQVSGAIVELSVKPGDRVKRGDILLRLDARAAEQTAVAGQAQVAAARATLNVASRDFARQKQLFEQRFISQASLDQAEAVFKSTEAQLNSQISQAAATRSQADFAVIRAPYAGVVAEVPIVMGDMALPGRPLLILYDPTALRVTATAPPSTNLTGLSPEQIYIDIPALPSNAKSIKPIRSELLPIADASTQTLQLRLDLPAGIKLAMPGMFARVWLPVTATTSGTGLAAASGTVHGPVSGPVYIPSKAVVRRAEMTGVYVMTADGKPILRQVRLGQMDRNRVEILSGLSAGERIVSEPQLAAALTTTAKAGK